MSQIYTKLSEKSLAAALSSIEIYNKPNFQYREEIFTVLIINSWELLLKAKVLRDAADNLEVLYVKDNQGNIKLSRNGSPMTKEITRIMTEVGLSQIVKENLTALIEIRDTAIHFYNSEPLSYILYTLGVASLKNYQKLVSDWFGMSLLDYNFYILPLGFAYNFKTLSLLEMECNPEPISNLLKSVACTQSSIDQADEFQFICEISVSMKSAKQLVTDADLTVAIDPAAENVKFVERIVSPTDKYPFSYTEIRKKILEARPKTKSTIIDKIIREYKIKTNPAMSFYNFRTKAQQKDYEKTGTLSSSIPSIYNDNAIRFIIEHIEV